MRPIITIASNIQPIRADHYSDEAEKSIIVSCLVKPDALLDVGSKLVSEDFDGTLHKRIMDILLGLHTEGRKPSIESVSAVVGDSEVAPNVTMRSYLKTIIEERLSQLHLPLQDAIETVLDASQRRKLAGLGYSMSLGATSGAQSVTEVANEAMMGVDELLASMRSGKRKSYHAFDAAQAAINLLGAGAKIDFPTTGLADLDKMIGGWPRGQLSIVAGRPGMGKSLFAVDAVLKAAKAGNSTLFFSLEMLDEQLGARILADLSYTNQEPIYYEDIGMRRIPAVGRQIGRLHTAHNQLQGLPLYVEEQRGVTVADIIARTTKHANIAARANNPLRLVVVDHIGLVRASDRYKGQRHRELAEISDGLATLAKDLDISMVGLCQLNRGVEGRDNKRPTTADLRESGAIEEDASVIIFLYRAAFYLEKQRYDEAEAEAARVAMLDQVRHKIELSVDKNRNGRVGIIDAFIDVGANALRNGSFAQ